MGIPEGPAIVRFQLGPHGLRYLRRVPGVSEIYELVDERDEATVFTPGHAMLLARTWGGRCIDAAADAIGDEPDV
jgi:hypothetical protein